VFNIDTDASRAQQDTYEVQETQSGVHYATVDGTADGEETELARQLRKDGVVDLRNTMDTDGEITWAPGMLHPSRAYDGFRFRKHAHVLNKY
jgi:hypothetical protein